MNDTQDVTRERTMTTLEIDEDVEGQMLACRGNGPKRAEEVEEEDVEGHRFHMHHH